MNRQDLRLPTAFLLDARRPRRARSTAIASTSTRIVARRGARSRRRTAEARLVARRAVSGHAPLAAAAAQLPALRPRAARSGARRRGGGRLRARGAGEPERLDAVSAGHAAGQERRDRAGPAPRSSGRSPCSRIWPRPATTSARCWRRPATSTAAIARFRAALAVDARLPRRARTISAMRCSLTGHDDEAARALREGARAAAGLSRGAQQPGPAARPGRRPRRRRALLPRRAGADGDAYGEAANNLALVLVNRGQTRGGDPPARGVPGEGRRRSRAPT